MVARLSTVDEDPLANAGVESWLGRLEIKGLGEGIGAATGGVSRPELLAPPDERELAAAGGVLPLRPELPLLIDSMALSTASMVARLSTVDEDPLANAGVESWLGRLEIKGLGEGIGAATGLAPRPELQA